MGVTDETKSIMASNHERDGNGGGNRGSNAAHSRAPDWADGLKQLYDSVVEEELPENFRDLLSRLDQTDPAQGHDTYRPGNDNGAPPPAPGGGSGRR